MVSLKKTFHDSVMTIITLSITTLVGVALLTIFISFWITELTDNDAHAINLSGSMRMQTYRMGMAVQSGDSSLVKQYIEQLDNTWTHAIFSKQRHQQSESSLSKKFHLALNHWQQYVRPIIQEGFQNKRQPDHLPSLLEKQVFLIDQLVSAFQQHAEKKIRSLRLLQLIAFFITIFIGSLIFHIIKNRVEKPLITLTEAARSIGLGNFDTRVDVKGKDELALLAETFNQTCYSINNLYSELDAKFQQKTQELQQQNITLDFLFHSARTILDSNVDNFNHQNLLDKLSTIIQTDSIELCLFTPQGNTPYLQLAPTHVPLKDCSNRSCAECFSHDPINSSLIKTENNFLVSHGEKNYGVLVVQSKALTTLAEWEQQLLGAVADQIAIALSLTERKNQDRRIALLNERTVIARELHDSLAQALSYLQMQVTRLQKSYDKQKYDLQQPIIDELREGLSSAYRQLRELLTTFRLQVNEGGLEAALQSTVKQLLERSHMSVTLNYKLQAIPLTPTEEIHLLQIIREASQNAINHSQGNTVIITLQQRPDKTIELTVDDDGIGIPDSPEKLNHYGLAIMNERSRHLEGNVEICNKESGGARVCFSFTPAFLAV